MATKQSPLPIISIGRYNCKTQLVTWQPIQSKLPLTSRDKWQQKRLTLAKKRGK